LETGDLSANLGIASGLLPTLRNGRSRFIHHLLSQVIFPEGLTSAISNLAGRPIAVSDIYQKIHETTLRTPVEMGVRPNSITFEEYQATINQQAINMVQDMQDGDKGEKVEALQANMQFLYGQEINTD
ncbi:hypothetical protein FGC34_01390, partial [Streptococcus pyogenes]